MKAMQVVICIEAVGHQMETLNDSFELIRKRGTVVAFGVPDQPVYAVEFETFFRKNAQLVAVVTPEWSEYLAKARDLFIECREELEMLVTHRFPIQAAAKAFTLYERHEDGLLKAILDASCWETNCELITGIKRRGLDVQVVHPVTLLDQAYEGSNLKPLRRLG